ncbi:hypothetical protein HYT23_01055 [Candidatus Pacearchaeota archaeon]|nr:hypothetical protein [Candidatus Pacearchaeota archaeon]
MGLKKKGLSLNLTLAVSLIIILGLASFVFAAVLKNSPVSVTPSDEDSINTQFTTSDVASTQPIVTSQPVSEVTTNINSSPLKSENSALAISCSLANCSIDSAIVFDESELSPNKIMYSFYGHQPKIPIPVDWPVQYRWWVPTNSSKEYDVLATPQIAGQRFRVPSISFKRSDGYPVVAWVGEKLGTFGQPYESWVYFSEWNGNVWTAPNVLYHGSVADPNELKFDFPTVSVDVSDNIILTWFIIEPGQNPKLMFKTRKDGVWSVESILRSNANINSKIAPDFTFTSKIVDGTITRHDGYLIWAEKTHQQDVNCGLNSVTVSHEKIFYSRWGGSSFGAVAEIDGQVNPTNPSQYNRTVAGGNIVERGRIGISSDKNGRVTAVWAKTEPHDPCVFPNPTATSVWYSDKPINSLIWVNTSALTNGFDPSISFSMSLDTFAVEDRGIMVYSRGNPNNGPTTILFAEKNGGWGPSIESTYSTCVSSSLNRLVRAASLHKDKFMAVWNSGQTLCTQGMKPSTRITENPLTLSSAGWMDIEAHTGSPTNPYAMWNFLVYQASDNPDHQEDSRNFHKDEMISVGSTNQVNIIRQQDKNSNHRAHRSYLKKDQEKIVADIGNINSATSGELTNFAVWATEQYPSKRTIFVTSEHGDGWRGLNWDYNPTPNDGTTLQELKKGLSDTGLFIDILLMHNCLMAMVETAYELDPLAGIIGFSQECHVSYDYGYNYMLGNLTSNPLVEHEDFAKLAVDADKLATIGKNSAGSTFSIIQPYYTTYLVNRINNFAQAMLNNLSANKPQILSALSGAQKMGERDLATGLYDYEEYVDLYNFAERVKNLVQDENIKNNASEVMDMINNSFVIKYWFDAPKTNAHGVNIYLENRSLILKNWTKYYNETRFSKDTKWLALLTNLSGSSGIKVILDDNGYLSLYTQDNIGRKTGGIFSVPSSNGQLLDGGRRIVDIPGSYYSDYGFESDCDCYRQDVVLPMETNNFTWYINGSLLQNTSTYNLSIQVIVDDVVTNTQFISGSIKPGEVVSGQFPQPAGELVVGNDVQVSSASGISKDSSVSTDSNGNVHITWEDSRNAFFEIFYEKLNNNGNTLINENQESFGSEAAASQSTVDSDNSGNLHMTWQKGGSGQRIFYKKIDSNGNVLINQTIINSAPLLADFPALSVDNNGNSHIIWIDYRNGGGEIYYEKLNNNGSAIVDDLRTTFTGNSPDYPYMDTDGNGNVYAVWGDNKQGNKEIYYEKLDNNGLNLTQEIRISNFLGVSEFPAIASDPLGNTYIVWQDQRDGNKEIYLSKLDSNGNKLIDQQRITNNPTVSDWPVVDVDSKNKIYIVWQDNRNGNYALYFTRLYLNGSVEIADTRLTLGPENVSLPDISIDNNDNVHVTWQNDDNHEIYYKKLSETCESCFSVDLISPLQNTTLNWNIVSFFYKVNVLNPISSCSLIINGSIVQTSNNVLRGVTQGFGYTLLDGNHTWQVSYAETSTMTVFMMFLML